ncbi:hypothetical protein D5086_027207 [Populus alba]|uniref:Uncharacterized protein n=1 Tax=Populus alba TaxID=43335 RepID=A0ACC4B5S2_POPAL
MCFYVTHLGFLLVLGLSALPLMGLHVILRMHLFRLGYSNLLGFDEAEFDRCRVVFFFYPKKCVLVATYSDDDHLADAHSTLEDAFGGGSSKTPTFSMDSTIVCINGIFSSPGISASSISANIGIFSESVVEILWYWVSGSGSDSPDHGVQVAAAISLPLHPFARARRVLDGACPSRDLVNAAKFMDAWLLAKQHCCLLYGMASNGVPIIDVGMLFKEGYVFLDADCILVEGCSMELVLWSLGLYVPHAWYARVAWFVPALLYWFVVVCCSL